MSAAARFGARLAERINGYDRTLMLAGAALLGAGIVMSMAASPGATAQVGYDTAFHFAWKHVAFVLAGLATFAFAASLSPTGVRRFGALLFLAAIVVMVLVLFFGTEIKGAQRWLDIAGVSVQPSEFLKPALIVMAAWMLSERMKAPGFPGLTAVGVLFGISAALLVMQPDVGQTALLAACMAAMLFAAGVSWVWLAGGAAGAGVIGLVLYHLLPHVKARVDTFIGPESGYQVGRALEAISGGGLLGRGPGEGIIKHKLPDAHSDFIYAVSAEEFGLLASVGLVWLYGLIAWRGLSRAGKLVDPFAQLAAFGLFTLFVMQAAIHIAVNVSFAPAKGMTLPLVSYGGSSMLGSAVTLGLAFALTRWRPGAFLYEAEKS